MSGRCGDRMVVGFTTTFEKITIVIQYYTSLCHGSSGTKQLAWDQTDCLRRFII
jgi:hypothetical protein